MPIAWPSRLGPDRADAFVSNEIRIAAPPERAFAWLAAAARWPEWYPNASAVRIEGGAATLSAGARFSWRTFGVAVDSTVREFRPPEAIAWDGHAILLEVYHAWLIRPDQDGCRVLTEETQFGLSARVQALLMPRRMYRGHALWLERLKRQAESRATPAGP
jgi:uncharacterized protein YndB with AHSA1/START domain